MRNICAIPMVLAIFSSLTFADESATKTDPVLNAPHAASVPAEDANDGEDDMREFGGFVDVPPVGPAMIIADARSAADSAVPARVAGTVREMLKLGASCKVSPFNGGETPFAHAVSLRKAEKGLLVILLCDGAKDEPALAVYPEERVAIVSAAAATAFAKGQDAEKRLVKEIWRGIGFICGAGYDQYAAGVMQPVSSPLELDMVQWQVVHPLSFERMNKFFAKYGVGRSRRYTYKRACEEGWAPPPTNDYQRAIFEAVKTNKTDSVSSPAATPSAK